MFFEKLMKKLQLAEVLIKGAEIRVSQSKNHQIVFMSFTDAVSIPEHEHSKQFEFVIDGKVDIFLDGKKNTYEKGDQFFISEGVLHSARIYSGYKAIAFFDEPDRYPVK